jgi:hypothetical protein
LFPVAAALFSQLGLLLGSLPVLLCSLETLLPTAPFAVGNNIPSKLNKTSKLQSSMPSIAAQRRCLVLFFELLLLTAPWAMLGQLPVFA